MLESVSDSLLFTDTFVSLTILVGYTLRFGAKVRGVEVVRVLRLEKFIL